MNNILLCDLGGTHARFAKFETVGTYSNFKKYRLNDFTAFDDIVQKYHDDTGLHFQSARFSVARTPNNGRIEYQRHAGDPDYVIDFNVVESKFGWVNVLYLNDLEVAAHGLLVLSEKDIETVIKSKGQPWDDNKIIISVGTGIGHAGILNGQIMRTCGGHFLPVTVTENQRKIESFVRRKKDKDFSLIMEDFVSGRGLRMIAEYMMGISNDDVTPEEFMQDLKNHPDVVTLFFEFLGLYAHMVTNVSGMYGGVYLTGGVIDNLINHGLTDWDAFHTFFKSKMVSVVENRLNGCSINYILNDELPLLGLTVF